MRVSLEQAIALLNAEQVVAIPTETVYGLAARVDSPSAIEQIFRLKNRPTDNPLIIHIAHAEDVHRFIDPCHPVPKEDLERLIHCFWPGPLTLVVPIDTTTIPSAARAALNTAGLRLPALPITRALIEQTGPLVAPSANRSGFPSATSAAHVEQDFGTTLPVLDGGSCQKGLESTIVAFIDDTWKILRQGALPIDAIAQAVHHPIEIVHKTGEKPLSPGQRYRHYAPKADLHLGVPITCPYHNAAILGFLERDYPAGIKRINLGSLSDPQTVACNLYAALRQLDDEQIALAFVDTDFPRIGLWLTILERLTRASKK